MCRVFCHNNRIFHPSVVPPLYVLCKCFLDSCPTILQHQVSRWGEICLIQSPTSSIQVFLYKISSFLQKDTFSTKRDEISSYIWVPQRKKLLKYIQTSKFIHLGEFQLMDTSKLQINKNNCLFSDELNCFLNCFQQILLDHH